MVLIFCCVRGRAEETFLPSSNAILSSAGNLDTLDGAKLGEFFLQFLFGTLVLEVSDIDDASGGNGGALFTAGLFAETAIAIGIAIDAIVLHITRPTIITRVLATLKG